MTRCPCSKGVCRPSTSFFYKVLSSLKQLQSHKKYCNGACLEDITKFIDKTYHLTGDLLSQVENALNTAEGHKFLIKKKNLYALVCPAATLQFTPAPCVKAKLERIQEVFNSKWCEDDDTARRSGRKKLKRESHSPLHFIPPTDTNAPPVKISKTNIKNGKSRYSLRKNVSDTSNASNCSVFGKGNESTPDQTSAPLKSYITSYLKSSFKSCLCGSSKRKPQCCSLSRDPSKEKERNTSSQQHLPEKRMSSPDPQKSPKKKRRRHSKKRNSSSRSRSIGANPSNRSKRSKNTGRDSSSRRFSRRKRSSSSKRNLSKKPRNNSCDIPNQRMRCPGPPEGTFPVSNDDTNSDTSEC